MFGLFSLYGWRSFLHGSLNWFHSIFWFLSMIIVALSAGVIWGGLFR